MRTGTVLMVAGLLTACRETPASAAPAWTTDLPAAQAQARKEQKLVFVDFTGSDWCGWCKRLKAEVFDTRKFGDYAATNLVLVEVDFPARKAQSAELKKANAALKQKYQPEGYPTLLLLDPDGRQLWRQPGYLPGGPDAMIAAIEKARKR